MLDPTNTFFIADFHFDHANIIKYCNRPFSSTEEMNTFMLERYNTVIRDDSDVYFLGDMAFGRGSRTPQWWLSQLKGHITYIKGSHDHGLRPTNLANCYSYLILDTGQGKVLLIHKPYVKPEGYKGWIIHGHTHSTQLINVQYKSVCVGVEAVNYAPISLQQMREKIKGGRKSVS